MSTGTSQGTRSSHAADSGDTGPPGGSPERSRTPPAPSLRCKCMAGRATVPAELHPRREFGPEQSLPVRLTNQRH